MPPVVAIQDHFEDSVALSSTHDDAVSFLVDIPTSSWFLFLVCQDNGAGGLIAFNSLDNGSFSQPNGPGGIPGIIQAFEVDSGANAYVSRSEFSTLESPISTSDAADVHYNATGATIDDRVYLGIAWDIALDNAMPNATSDIDAFDGYENGEGTGTDVLATLLEDDRFWTRTGADPQGRPGLLIAQLGWDDSGTPAFTPDAGWSLAASYAPAGTYGVALYYKLFDPVDGDLAFAGSFDASTDWQAHVAAYKVLPVEEGTDNPAEGICVALENDTHELDQVWTRIDDPDA